MAFHEQSYRALGVAQPRVLLQCLFDDGPFDTSRTLDTKHCQKGWGSQRSNQTKQHDCGTQWKNRHRRPFPHIVSGFGKPSSDVDIGQKKLRLVHQSVVITKDEPIADNCRNTESHTDSRVAVNEPPHTVSQLNKLLKERKFSVVHVCVNWPLPAWLHGRVRSRH